jgi:hypothetical protein
MDDGRFRLPEPHSGVQLCVDYSRGVNDDRELMLIYSGAAEALIAAGVAPAELLARGKPGNARRDAAGDRAMVNYRKTWLELRLYKSIEAACRLPGVTPAVVAAAREKTSQAMRACGIAWEGAEVAPAPMHTQKQRPSYLRLVVDNDSL